MSVAESIAGFESAVLPSENRAGQLRLVAPWHEDHEAWPDVAQSPEVDPLTVTPADHRAAATALHEVLREWRAIARELEAGPSEGPDRALLEAQENALREVHNRLFTELSETQEPGLEEDSPGWD